MKNSHQSSDEDYAKHMIIHQKNPCPPKSSHNLILHTIFLIVTLYKIIILTDDNHKSNIFNQQFLFCTRY